MGVPLAWAAQWLGAVPPALVAMPVALAVGLAAWRQLARQERSKPPSRLRWDGTAWSLLPAPGAAAMTGSATLVLDLGSWMLVRFRAPGQDGAGAVAWLPLRLAGDPARWCALRAALWTWRGQASPEWR